MPTPPGESNSVLADVLNAGIDPAGAFGAAFGLNRVVGRDSFNEWLQHKAGVQPPAPAASPAPSAPASAPQTNLDGSVSSPMDDKTATIKTPQGEGSGLLGPDGKPVNSAGPDGDAARAATKPAADDAAARAASRGAADDAAEASAKASKRALGKVLVEDGAKSALRQGVVQATTRGAALGGRFAAGALLRLGAMSVPGLGLAITAALWVFDTDGRKAFNGLMEHLTGTVTPDVNAPPEAGRTKFLPLTHDGNRDPTIEEIDAAMTKANDATFGFAEDMVWPLDDRAMQTTSDFAPVTEKFTKFTADLGETLQQITTIYQGVPDEQFVTRAWNDTRPGMEKLSEFQTTMLPNMFGVLKRAVESGNNAYQGLRKVNLSNRETIANSNSGIFSFFGNNIHREDMSGGVEEMRTAVDDMQKLVPGIVSALDGLTIAPNARVSGSGFGGTTSGDTSPGGQPEQPAAPGAPAAPAVTPLPPASVNPADNKTAQPDNPAKDLASMLKNAVPNTGMGMPMMPQMPQVPNLGSMMPQSMPSAKPAGLDARELPDDLKAKLADRLKEPDKKDPLTEPGKGKAPEGVLSPQPVPAGQHPGQQRPVTEPASDKPGEQKPPVASNTVEVNGRKWTFDNPKLASMVDGLKSGDGHHSLRQVASDAGFRLPPVGQDIGTEVPTNELKPGNVIMGANNQNGVFLGVGDDGQALAINENGEVKPLHEIAKWDGGPHQGFFKLADDGAPTPAVQEAAGHQPAAPPAPGNPAPPPPSTPSTQDTNPGILPGQVTGNRGLDPGGVPPNQ